MILFSKCRKIGDILSYNLFNVCPVKSKVTNESVQKYAAIIFWYGNILWYQQLMKLTEQSLPLARNSIYKYEQYTWQIVNSRWDQSYHIRYIYIYRCVCVCSPYAPRKNYWELYRYIITWGGRKFNSSLITIWNIWYCICTIPITKTNVLLLDRRPGVKIK